MWRLPLHTVLFPVLTAVPLGIARGALDEIATHIREGRVARRGQIADDPVAVAEFADADSRLRAAWALLRESVTEAHVLAERGGAVDGPLRARIALACLHACDTAAPSPRSPTTSVGATPPTSTARCRGRCATSRRRASTCCSPTSTGSSSARRWPVSTSSTRRSSSDPATIDSPLMRVACSAGFGHPIRLSTNASRIHAMPTVLIANTGRQTGSAASRRLRREDRIPGVVHGHGMEPLSVSVDRRELRAAVSGAAGLNTVLDLTVDSAVYPAIIKDLQRHPVRRTISHIDFLQVNLDEEITVSVPLRLEGEATEVLQNNGLVDPAVDAIEVVTTPRQHPRRVRRRRQRDDDGHRHPPRGHRDA